MTSPCLTAGGLRFLGHRVPAAGLGRPSEDRRAYWPVGQTATGLPCSALVRRDGVGCLLYRGAVVSAAAAGAACRPYARSSPWWQPSFSATFYDAASAKVHSRSPCPSFPGPVPPDGSESP